MEIQAAKKGAMNRANSHMDITLDAKSYQRLLDLAAQADAREGIRQGLEESKAGKGRAVEEFFAEFEAANGIPG